MANDTLEDVNGTELAPRHHGYKLSNPLPFIWTMVIFLIIIGFIAAILYRQAHTAFMTNPGLNGLILGVLGIGIILIFSQVISLIPEVRWFNSFRAAGSADRVGKEPRLLAPMRALLGRSRHVALSTNVLRSILDSIGTRLDETRDISRYLIGLLVFLGLLGTFWGLIGTIGSISEVIQGLDPNSGNNNDILTALKSGLTAPLSGMGTAFSASLLGLSGSLILGFLDLQASQAQNAFYTDLEDWMTSMTELDHPVTQMQATGLGVSGDEMSAMLAQFGSTLQNSSSSQNAIRAMAELARGIDGLVKHIKAEQEDLRGHIIQQGETNKRLQQLMEAMIREGESDRRPN